MPRAHGLPARSSDPGIHLVAALESLPIAEWNVLAQLLGMAASALVVGGLAVMACARWNRPVLAAVAVGFISATFLACGAVGIQRTENLFSCWRIGKYLAAVNSGARQ